jgi:hypothetical protein
MEAFQRAPHLVPTDDSFSVNVFWGSVRARMDNVANPSDQQQNQ